jgi:hypothetical protein
MKKPNTIRRISRVIRAAITHPRNIRDATRKWQRL